ncbi:MAG: hypothetical protein CL608_14290 [Anaerolineaceae bacterium]|nr:hypothetical protein [Anaerolineaceae bacterium]
MIDDSTKKQQRCQGEPDRSNQPLFGKVVLLIGNDTAVLQDLVKQLAQKGANVALLCWQMPVEVARKMQEHVQSLGQQLMLIQRAENQRFSVEQLIHNVIDKWGQFDFFIDLSAAGGTAVPTDEAEEKEPQTGWLPPKWQLTRTVLEEMAQS